MKNVVMWCLALAFLAGVLGTPVVAADDAKVEKAFKKMDKNGDGKVTLDEAKAGKEGKKAERAEKRFKKLDKDGDGSLTLEEFKAGAKKKKKDA